jgi:hypothetical protein
VGGSYKESGLSDITLSWMLQKAQKHGLVLSPEAVAINLNPSADGIGGMAHDEWKLVPWGIPEHRKVPSVATISNTVQSRLDSTGDYTPSNLELDGRKLKGYSVASVLPYSE